MRQISKSKQISVPSLAEIRRAVRDEAERVGDELGLKGGSDRQRVAASSHLVNWWLCYMLRLPVEERNRITREGKIIFDRHIAEDTPRGFGESDSRPAEAAVPPKGRRYHPGA